MELFAYIDPFTGSLVLQVLAMAFFSVLVFFRRVKNAVLSCFGMKPKQDAAFDEEPDVIKLNNADEKKEHHKAV